MKKVLRRPIARACAVAAGSTLLLVFAFTGLASASTVTLGLTTPPTGSTAIQCSPSSSGQDVIFQLTQASSTPYFVPAGGGTITSWSTNTTGDTSGGTLTFSVLRLNSDGTYTVVGADTETIPDPLPVSHVVRFTLSTPIAVSGGETLGLYAAVPNTQTCYFAGGATPSGDGLAALLAPTTPSSGQILSLDTGKGPSPPGFTLDVAATLVTQTNTQNGQGQNNNNQGQNNNH